MNMFRVRWMAWLCALSLGSCVETIDQVPLEDYTVEPLVGHRTSMKDAETTRWLEPGGSAADWTNHDAPSTIRVTVGTASQHVLYDQNGAPVSSHAWDERFRTNALATAHMTLELLTPDACSVRDELTERSCLQGVCSFDLMIHGTSCAYEITLQRADDGVMRGCFEHHWLGSTPRELCPQG